MATFFGGFPRGSQPVAIFSGAPAGRHQVSFGDADAVTAADADAFQAQLDAASAQQGVTAPPPAQMGPPAPAGNVPASTPPPAGGSSWTPWLNAGAQFVTGLMQNNQHVQGPQYGAGYGVPGSSSGVVPGYGMTGLLGASHRTPAWVVPVAVGAGLLALGVVGYAVMARR